jgi:hypothetical protein
MATGLRLEELEYSWYAEQNPTGVPSNPSTEELQRAYWHSVVGEDQSPEDSERLELRWLQSLTGVTSDDYDTAWAEAVAGAGETPQENTNANKILYYQTQ